jgi:hypothetical protein
VGVIRWPEEDANLSQSGYGIEGGCTAMEPCEEEPFFRRRRGNVWNLEEKTGRVALDGEGQLGSAVGLESLAMRELTEDSAGSSVGRFLSVRCAFDFKAMVTSEDA